MNINVVPHVLVSAGFKKLLQLSWSNAVQLIKNFWLDKKKIWASLD